MSNSTENHPQKTLETKYYYRQDIDGLRGFAVSLVIFYHLFPELLKNGFLGVDIFFVISGFVVIQALNRNLLLGNINGLKIFYSHRIKRIMPALYFNTLFSIVLTCLFIPPSDLRSIFKTAATAICGASNIGLLYARFNYFSLDLLLNPFVHTWSLGVEEQFYFIFPSLLILSNLLISRIRFFEAKHLLTFVLTASFFYWLHLSSNSPMLSFYHPLARFWELMSGAILALKMDSITAKLKGNKIPALQFLALIFLTLGLFLFPNNLSLNFWSNIFVVIASALCIVTGSVTNSKLNKLLSSSAIVWIGKLSYSLYLWHYPVFTLARWNLDLSQPIYPLLSLLVTFLLAYLSYRAIEIPFRYASIKNGKVVFIGAISGLLSLAFIFGLYHLPPSRLYLGNASQYTELWPLDQSPLTASLYTSQRNCHLQYQDALSPDLFEKCSTKDKNSRHIYLMGNSHAQHLVPMLEVVSKTKGYGYTAVTISNCRMISSFQMMVDINYRYDLCKNYFDNSVDYILKKAKVGDLVLIGDRSLFETPHPNEAFNLSNIYSDNGPLSVQQVYDKSLSDLSSFADDLNAKGAKLIIEESTPQFVISATQCAPEWFRLQNHQCKVSKQFVKTNNSKYTNAIRDIQAKNKNVYSWDPLSELCDGDDCHALKNNKLLYRDQHHLSYYGSEQLAPGFLKMIDSLLLKNTRQN